MDDVELWERVLPGVADKLREGASEVDRAGVFPTENFRLLHESGLLAYTVPRRLGGLGMGPTGDYRGLFRVLEEVTRACSSTGQSLGVHGSAMSTINLIGTPEQQVRFAAEVTERGRVFGYFGSEPQQRRSPTGEPMGWDTVARKVAGGWRLDGRKFFATNSTGASWFMVLATGVDGEQAEIATPMVRADAPGVTVHDTWDNMGQRATMSGRVDFDDVFVPDEDMIGELGSFQETMPIAPTWQLAFVARYVGMARAALDFTVDYLRNGAPVPDGLQSASEDPQIQSRIADMSVLVEGAAALLYRAADVVARCEKEPAAVADAWLAVNQAKVMSTSAALEVPTMLFQLCGARVTDRSYNADRFWRNARTLTLHDPVDKRRLAIGRALLGVSDGALSDRIATARVDRLVGRGARGSDPDGGSAAGQGLSHDHAELKGSR